MFVQPATVVVVEGVVVVEVVVSGRGEVVVVVVLVEVVVRRMHGVLKQYVARGKIPPYLNAPPLLSGLLVNPFTETSQLFSLNTLPSGPVSSLR